MRNLRQIEETKSSYTKEQLEKRLAKLVGGVALIKASKGDLAQHDMLDFVAACGSTGGMWLCQVGATTETELKAGAIGFHLRSSCPTRCDVTSGQEAPIGGCDQCHEGRVTACNLSAAESRKHLPGRSRRRHRARWGCCSAPDSAWLLAAARGAMSVRVCSVNEHVNEQRDATFRKRCGRGHRKTSRRWLRLKAWP